MSYLCWCFVYSILAYLRLVFILCSILSNKLLNTIVFSFLLSCKFASFASVIDLSICLFLMHWLELEQPSFFEVIKRVVCYFNVANQNLLICPYRCQTESTWGALVYFHARSPAYFRLTDWFLRCWGVTTGLFFLNLYVCF